MCISSWLGMYQYHILHHHYWMSLQSQDPYQDSLRESKEVIQRNEEAKFLKSNFLVSVLGNV